MQCTLRRGQLGIEKADEQWSGRRSQPVPYQDPTCWSIQQSFIICLQFPEQQFYLFSDFGWPRWLARPSWQTCQGFLVANFPWTVVQPSRCLGHQWLLPPQTVCRPILQSARSPHHLWQLPIHSLSLKCQRGLMPGVSNCLSDPGVPGVRSMGPDSLTHSLTTRLCADLSDVTLAHEDSNSIPIDDVNGTIKSWEKVEKRWKKLRKSWE